MMIQNGISVPPEKIMIEIDLNLRWYCDVLN